MMVIDDLTVSLSAQRIPHRAASSLEPVSGRRKVNQVRHRRATSGRNHVEALIAIWPVPAQWGLNLR
jgi:hypothetical protein